MSRINKQSGFTLIELIIVIVILGILAVTAAPRFINLSSDAQASVIETMAANLYSADRLVYAKSVIKGIEGLDRDGEVSFQTVGVDFNGVFISTIFGTPWMYSGQAAAILLSADILDEGSDDIERVCAYEGDFCAMILLDELGVNTTGETYSPGVALAIYPSGYKVSDNCFAYHIFDRTTLLTKTGSITTGC